MTVATTTRKMTPQAMDGVTLDFNFSFRALTTDAETIKAFITDGSGVNTDLVYGDSGINGYTVSVNSNGIGGAITVINARTSDYTITIYREVGITQGSDYNDRNSFPAETLESNLDKLTMIAQEIDEEISRSIKVDINSSIDVTLPTASAGKALLWNATADGLENSTDNFNDIVTDATAQAVIATTQAGISTTQAGIATTQAGLADTARAAAQTAQGLAETAQGLAEDAQDLAEDWASKTDGQVDSTDYSSKAYAIGGTGVTSAIGASKEWAITAEDTEVTTGNYSALHHAAKAAASALAAQVAKIEWQGTWSAGTYQANDAVEKDGTSYIATTTTTETPSVTATDWDVLALKGTDWTGSGDVSSSISSSTDGSVAVFDGTTGKLIKELTTALPVAKGGTGSATQNFVDLTEAQTIAGIKTFSSFPVSPSSAPSSDYEVANKKYVDDNAGGGSGKVVGEVFWFAGSSVPEDCLECDGAAISRTTYADLFTAIGTTWGVGDGSTTFNIPNAKTAGRFLRSRTASVALGTAQDGAYLNHSHTASSNSTGSHSHSAPGGTTPGGGNYFQVATVSYSGVSTSSDGNHSHTITVSASTTGGTETRPTNLSMILCIKY